ncbi:MAG: chemotaxis protein CheA, partial [Pseudomonadota bacterium]
MSDAMAEIRASFFVECEDLLEALQDGLETMATAKANDETVNVVFRAVHSIKGGAAAFGLDQLVDFTHAFETTLDALRSGQIAVDERVTDVLYRAADLLSDVVQAARDGTLLDQAKLDPVIGDLHTLLEPDFSETPGAQDDPGPARDSIAPTLERDPAEADTNVFTISFTPKPDFYAAGSEPLFVFGLLEDLGELEVEVGPTKTLPNLDMLTSDAALLTWSITLTTSAGREAIEDIFEFATDLCDFEFCEGLAQTTTTQTDLDDDDANPTDQEVPPSPSNAPAHTVRVDVDRIDRLVNLVGELVINQAMLSQSVNAAGYASNSPVANGLDELQHLTRNIQESVMMIRAQPVKSLFQRMGRVVREVSTRLGKDVQLVTEGDTTEIDKTVVELLADPLTHMIRNALDHGLETPDGRRRAGKSNQGTISLSAAHRSGRVIIEVADDGAGIDRSKVREIAEQKGLVDPQHNLSEAEIDSLLFMPGFSTSETVSNLSGRGVGMDVVKAAISSLGGRITISSTPGLGTRFSISLPLTLAVLDG